MNARDAHSVLEVFLAHAEADPARLVILDGAGGGLSRGELRARALGVAAALTERGVRAGDRVLLSASQSTAFVEAYLATHWLGAIAVPVDPQATEPHLRYLIERTEPRAVFPARALGGEASATIDMLAAEGARMPAFAHPAPPRGDAVADLLFTTGTTGRPKGVVLTHAAVLAAARGINSFIGNTADDREVVPLPLSHSFGLGRLRCALVAGGALALAPGFTLPGKVFRLLQETRATGFSFVPAGFNVLARFLGDRLGELAPHLRYIEIGSAPMPREHKERLMRLLPSTRLCMHYGLTEASRACFTEFHAAAARGALDAVGRARPGMELDLREGDEQRPAATGQVWVRGPSVMREYWRDAELTRAALTADGWFRTGDLGRFTDGGDLVLLGREHDLINVGGRKVSPAEVEECLNRLPAVAESACVGVPDPQGISGEVVKAFLVARAGHAQPPTAELIAALRAQLEPYKIPVEFEWVTALPKTSSGKIQRSALREG